MASIQDLLTGAQETITTATATNTVCTATVAAPAAGHQLWVTGFSISASIAPVASVNAQIRSPAASTAIRNFQLPVAAFAPIIYEFKRPIKCAEATSVDITVPDLGATVVCRVELITMDRPV